MLVPVGQRAIFRRARCLWSWRREVVVVAQPTMEAQEARRQRLPLEHARIAVMVGVVSHPLVMVAVRVPVRGEAAEAEAGIQPERMVAVLQVELFVAEVLLLPATQAAVAAATTADLVRIWTVVGVLRVAVVEVPTTSEHFSPLRRATAAATDK